MAVDTGIYSHWKVSSHALYVPFNCAYETICFLLVTKYVGMKYMTGSIKNDKQFKSMLHVAGKYERYLTAIIFS